MLIIPVLAQVCGSAHTALGPYLFSSSATPSTESLEFAQVSKRGGRIGITWDGRLGHEGGTVGLRGEARRAFLFTCLPSSSWY